MRYGVLSDIHANLPALDETLSALDREGIDRLVCAGDIIGYGPHPNECVERLIRADAVCVAGNHDLMVTGRLGEERARKRVRASNRWTREHLDEESRRFLAELPVSTRVEPGVLIAHGSSDDPEARIGDGRRAAAELARVARAEPAIRLVIVGNTHLPLLADERGGQFVPPAGAERELVDGRRYLINPGSVGQSREAQATARAAVVDTRDGWIRFLAIPYDVERVKVALRLAGLPVSGHHRPIHSRWHRIVRRLTRSQRSRPER